MKITVNDWNVAAMSKKDEPKPKRYTGNRYEARGKSLTIRQWSEITGNPPGTIWGRINSGWDVERAIFSRSKRQYQG